MSSADNHIHHKGQSLTKEHFKTETGLLREYLTLKKIRRTGWQLRGVRDSESLADHCFGVVLLTMLLAPTYAHRLDVN